MYGINGSNRMLVVTREDQNVRAWVKLVQAMIADLLELNRNPAVMRAIGDIGEGGAYNVSEVLYHYLDHCVSGDVPRETVGGTHESSIFGIWLKRNLVEWLFKKAGYMHVHPGASYGMRIACMCRSFVFTDSVLKPKKAGT